jgi:hypothetical protein
MAERMAGRLRAEGHPWADLAASALADRGGLGLDRAAYAALWGISEDAVAVLEDGVTVASVLRQAGSIGTKS